jgi:DNA-binding MarR family transcriptional regulator
MSWQLFPCIVNAVEREHPTTGSLVWHLAMRWRAAVDREVGPLGLTHARYSLLASLSALSSAGPPTQRELADYTGLAAIYVSKLARALERDGLIERDVDRSDSRARRLTLTAQGQQTVQQAMARVRALGAELTAALGGPDSAAISQLDAALSKLLAAAPAPDPDRQPIEGD